MRHLRHGREFHASRRILPLLLIIGVARVDAADVLVHEDFSAYALNPASDYPGLRSQLLSPNGSCGYMDIGGSGNHMSIDTCPWDASIKALGMDVVVSEQGDNAGWLLPATTTWLITEFDEYRDPTYHYDANKDIRWFGYLADHPFGMNLDLDIYSGLFGSNGGPATSIGINIQGLQPADQYPYTSWSVDAVVGCFGNAFSYANAVKHHLKYELKMNTPGNADGIADIVVDGVSIRRRTNVLWYTGSAQIYLKAFQFGMTPHNSYASPNRIWRSNLTLSIPSGAPNNAPVAAAQSVSTPAGTATAVTLSATDADGDALTYAIATSPAHGTLSGSGAARTYTPNSGYSGSDSFTFTASDGVATSNTATVSITVTAVNHAPVATAQSVSTAQDTSAAITLSGTDGDGDTLSYAIATTPVHGTLSGTGASRTYTPTVGYTGHDSFTFKVNDGVADSNVATVAIMVTAPGATGTGSTSGGSSGGGCGAGGTAGMVIGLGLMLRLRPRRR